MSTDGDDSRSDLVGAGGPCTYVSRRGGSPLFREYHRLGAGGREARNVAEGVLRRDVVRVRSHRDGAYPMYQRREPMPAGIRRRSASMSSRYPSCGGRIRVIAITEDSVVIRNIRIASGAAAFEFSCVLACVEKVKPLCLFVA